MDDFEDFFCSFVWAILGILLCGVLLCLGACLEAKGWKRQAVAHQAAHWTVDAKGDTTFEWNKPAGEGAK